jgi:hypothetical protein
MSAGTLDRGGSGSVTGRQTETTSASPALS